MSISQPNLAYAKVYAAHQRLSWTSDIFGMFAAARLNAMYEPAIKAEMATAYFQQYPRRKKFNMAELDPAVKFKVIAKWREIALANFEAWNVRYKKLGKLLDRLATITPITLPDLPADRWPVMKAADSYEYHTQGYGAAKYARESLVRDEVVLLAAKIPYSIEMVNHTDNLGHVDQYHAKFLLKAPLTDWQLDCLTRTYRPTLAQWAWDCWERGVNPKVYNPFLPDDIYEMTMHCMGDKNNPRPKGAQNDNRTSLTKAPLFPKG
jgi:hypothetical protein